MPVLCGMCRQMCPLLVRIDADGVVDISGNPASPLHGGKLCSRALAAVSLVDDPDRLRHPLKRTGKRGSGIWQRISWEEAIDTIVSRLRSAIRENGPQNVGLFSGRASSRFIVELCRQLGITNIAAADSNFCMEGGSGYPLAGVEREEPTAAVNSPGPPNVALFFGNHLGENINIAELRQILALRKSGGKVIVCDPRFSVLAGKADFHLMLRPGSDALVIFGWLRLILDSYLDQAAFADGPPAEILVAVRRRLEPFTPAHVSRLTDVDEETLVESAFLLGDPASMVKVHRGRFAAWHGNDSQRLFAVRLLSLVLDSLHCPPEEQADRLSLVAALFAENDGKAPIAEEVAKRTSGYNLLVKMLAAQVQTVGVWGSNPFHCYPNPYRTAVAFKKADFVFCCDLYPTEAALYADIILPEASFLESQRSFASWRYDGGEIVAAGFAALKPRFESRSAAWIVDQISRQFGTSLFDGQGVLLQDRVFLAAHGLTPDIFHPDNSIVVLDNAAGDRQGSSPDPVQSEGSAGNRNPGVGGGTLSSGQDNLSLEAGLYTLPSLIEVPSPPPGFARFFSGRLPVHTGSSTQDNSWLRVEISDNELWINDRIAADMGLKEGEEVHLINQDGIRSITAVRVKTTPGIRADCVYTPHGFGCFSPYLKRSFGQGLADGSMITRARSDAMTGRPGLRCNFVRLVRKGGLLSFPRQTGQDDAGSIPLLFQQGPPSGKG